MISFEFHLKNRHEKTQKPLWFLGFQPRYLFRCYLLVAGVGLEPHDLRVMSPTSYQLLHPAIWATISYCVFIIDHQERIVKYFLYKALFDTAIEYFAEKRADALKQSAPNLLSKIAIVVLRRLFRRRVLLLTVRSFFCLAHLKKLYRILFFRRGVLPGRRRSPMMHSSRLL